MREADVGSQSADTIKLRFGSQNFEMASGSIGQYPIATSKRKRPQLGDEPRPPFPRTLIGGNASGRELPSYLSVIRSKCLG